MYGVQQDARPPSQYSPGGPGPNPRKSLAMNDARMPNGNGSHPDLYAAVQTPYGYQSPPQPRQQQYQPPRPRYEPMPDDPDDDLPPIPDPSGDDFYQRNSTAFPGAFDPTRASQAFPMGGGGDDGSRSGSPQHPILDHSHLRPGTQAALLSHERTLQLYRANAKKTQDPDLQFEFAVFMIDASKSLPMPIPTRENAMEVERAQEKREELVKEATTLLKKLADRGHVASQYFLADCYANGIGTVKGRQDFDRAFPLFVLAAKHGHPDAAYRAGTCCENGWGCRRDSAKAVTFFRKGAAALHPGAMYRLGIAELNGELGLSKNPRDGVKWLKRSAEASTAEFPHALHELALLHERGIDNILFVDYEYAAELLAQAAELGYAPSAYRLGECYEYGKMGCPQDPALSIHYYNIAAQQDHRDACFALTAWYLVGSPGVLPQSDTEAFLWAKKAADGGLSKAMYAVGYFLEVGIGSTPNMRESMSWYQRAADLGDKRAMQRLKSSQHKPLPNVGAALGRRDGPPAQGGGKKDKDCVIM